MHDDPVTASLYPPDYEQVPTLAELASQGLARERTRRWFDRAEGKTKSDTRYEVSAEGQQMIYDAMRRNAERGRRFDMERRAA